MKKKKIIMILSLIGGLIIISMVVLIPILKAMDFFGANIIDGYIKNNSEYAKEYKKVINKNFKAKNGYVSLERILYFYLADNTLSFDEIYSDNLDSESKKLLPISQVCELKKYKVLDVCKGENISSSGQIDEEQAKPFAQPIEFTSSDIKGFFMEERIIYGRASNHRGWDISNQAQTPIYSVCDGIVRNVSFPYSTNTIDKSDMQGGNIVEISCEVNDIEYIVLYGHLFPNSSKVNIGDSVSQGQQIASVGMTGFATGNHLHYEVSLNGQVIDGMSLIDFGLDISNKFNFSSRILK